MEKFNIQSRNLLKGNMYIIWINFMMNAGLDSRFFANIEILWIHLKKELWRCTYVQISNFTFGFSRVCQIFNNINLQLHAYLDEWWFRFTFSWETSQLPEISFFLTHRKGMVSNHGYDEKFTESSRVYTKFDHNWALKALSMPVLW